MNKEKHLKVLALIAKEFNKEDIKWALGGSLLLYLKKITEDVHDIDIMVFSEDVNKAKSALSKLGETKPLILSKQFKTKHYYKYNILGIDIDLMADFIIVKDGVDYHFPLKKTSVDEVIEIDGQTIYLQRLADWAIFYELMDRKKRIEEIKKGQL